MSENKKSRFQESAKRIDEGLNDLSAALGDAINDVLTALQDGRNSAIVRDHVIETAHGPVKAYAGLQVQVGGMRLDPDGAADVQQPSDAQSSEADASSSSRKLDYELTENAKVWIVTADIPGVSHQNLRLAQDETTLLITTDGGRRYCARVELGGPFICDDVAISLARGILKLEIPKGADR